jgi:hypothetical protein
MLFYAAAKFVTYALWSYVGLRLVQPSRASFTLAARLGAVRWFL